MKKITVLLALLVLAVTMAAAETINIGDFPKGKWLDSAWGAVWEFSSDNIRIIDSNGTELYNFKDKITDFKVDVSLTKATISFACKDAGRTYVFTKGIKDLDLAMEINPDWSAENYLVTMAFQK